MSQAVEIKPANLPDAASLVALLQRCAEHMHQQGMSHWLGVYDAQSVAANLAGKQVYKLVIDNRIAGCIALSQQPSDYYRECWPQAPAADYYITQLAVDPDFQGQGLGQALVHFCLRQTRGAQIQLDAVAHYPALLKFYQQLGFEIIAEGVGLGDYRYLFTRVA